MLTIYTNHLGGNLVIKNKTTKFDEVGELPHKLAEETKKSRKITPPLNHSLSEAFQTDLRVPFDFPLVISGFSHVMDW